MITYRRTRNFKNEIVTGSKVQRTHMYVCDKHLDQMDDFLNTYIGGAISGVDND